MSRCRAASRSLVGRALIVFASVVLIASTVLVAPSAAASYVTMVRASVSSNSVQGNEWSGSPVLSSNGRYVAFASVASNLAPADFNGLQDIYVRDMDTGTTMRMSVSSAGVGGNSWSMSPAISGDGRLVAFTSNSSNLVSGDVNATEDIFVRDMTTNQTIRVSVSNDGVQGNGGSADPAMSADGRYVTFSSYSSNLVVGDTNGVSDVFVRDVTTDKTVRVSLSSHGEQGDLRSFSPAISANGRYVVFASFASNLVPGDLNGVDDIFMRDMTTGETTHISVSSAGVGGDGGSSSAAISSDGRYVAFSSIASNLVSGDTNGKNDIFVRDTVTGHTSRVSVSSTGTQGNGESHWPTISADGRYVGFTSGSSNLIPGDTNGNDDVFVHDMATGRTTRVSESVTGAEGHGAAGLPSLSADGRFVAFNSTAPNLVSGDTNGQQDIFVRDSAAPAGTARVQGADRYATSVEASKRAFSNADTVVIATGENWPDALGGSALAGTVKGPLLLTPTANLPSAVAAEITRLGASKAYVLGGAGAVSPAVENALVKSLGRAGVIRLSGADRYGTARAVADEVIKLQASSYTGDAFVATGGNFPDAAAASPLASALGRPILLVNPSTGEIYVPDSTKRVLILGGKGVVSDSAQLGLSARLGPTNVKREGGANRYETAAKVAQVGVDTGMSWDGVGLATGENFPDALSGGAMLGQLNSVMLLTPRVSLHPAAAAKLTANATSINKLHVIGGVRVVSPGAVSAARVAAGVP